MARLKAVESLLWILFTMIHRSCLMATENNSSRGYFAYHLLAHKQDGNERFYQSFSLVGQKSPLPTGRGINSPSAVSPESPLLFLIKTFLSLCTSSLFFRRWFEGEALLPTYSWQVAQRQRVYLDFIGLAKKWFIPTCNFRVLRPVASFKNSVTCLRSHWSSLPAVTFIVSIFSFISSHEAPFIHDGLCKVKDFVWLTSKELLEQRSFMLHFLH